MKAAKGSSEVAPAMASRANMKAVGNQNGSLSK